jgi:hypothetical protein
MARRMRLWRATLLTRCAEIIVAINLRLWGLLRVIGNTLTTMISRFRRISWSWVRGNSNKVGYFYGRRPRRLRIKMFTGLDEIGRSMNLIASAIQLDEVFDVFFGFVLVKCCPDSLTRLEKRKKKINKVEFEEENMLGAPDHHGHISSIQG